MFKLTRAMIDESSPEYICLIAWQTQKNIQYSIRNIQCSSVVLFEKVDSRVHSRFTIDDSRSRFTIVVHP
jgi:hypothetical protein